MKSLLSNVLFLVLAIAGLSGCASKPKLTKWHKSIKYFETDDYKKANSASKRVNISCFVLPSPRPVPAKLVRPDISSLQEKAQKELISKLSTPGVDHALLLKSLGGKFGEERLVANIEDRSIIVRQFVVSIEDVQHKVGERLHAIDFTVALDFNSEFEFIGWDQIQTKEATISLGNLNLNQENSFSISGTLGGNLGSLGSSGNSWNQTANWSDVTGNNVSNGTQTGPTENRGTSSESYTSQSSSGGGTTGANTAANTRTTGASASITPSYSTKSSMSEQMALMYRVMKLSGRLNKNSFSISMEASPGVNLNGNVVIEVFMESKAKESLWFNSNVCSKLDFEKTASEAIVAKAEMKPLVMPKSSTSKVEDLLSTNCSIEANYWFRTQEDSSKRSATTITESDDDIVIVIDHVKGPAFSVPGFKRESLLLYRLKTDNLPLNLQLFPATSPVALYFTDASSASKAAEAIKKLYSSTLPGVSTPIYVFSTSQVNLTTNSSQLAKVQVEAFLFGN